MTRKMLVLALGALALGACDASKKQLEQTLAQVQTVSAEKDSLLKDVMATSQFMADLNTELAEVRSRAAGKPVKGAAGEMESSLSPAQQREAIKAQVAELTTRVNEAESRLATSRNRVRDLARNNTALSAQAATYDSTISSFKAIIDNQKTEIASLTEQVNALQVENTTLRQDKATLAKDKEVLTAETARLTTEQNTVYYVIGTEDELFKKGIITKQGGVLGFGKTPVPTTTPKESDFTAVDRTQLTDIAFPDANHAYRIVSRQDVSALATTPDQANRIKGGLKIVDVTRFWAPSKFLILMEQ